MKHNIKENLRLMVEAKDCRIIIIIQDLVYGLYAYLIKDGKAYSLNYVNYSVELNPVKFYAGACKLSWWIRKLE